MPSTMLMNGIDPLLIIILIQYCCDSAPDND